jgi:hypothetical protein
MSPEAASKHISDVKQITKILSGQFKDINHAIAAAVHQTARTGVYDPSKPPITTTSYDNLEDQAKQSGMKTEIPVQIGHVAAFYNGSSNEDSYEHKAIQSWAKQHGVESSGELGLATFKEQFGDGGTAKLAPPTPGFMQATYKQYPKDIGYEQADKKVALPDNNSKEETFQLRKLVKSMKRIKELIAALSGAK